MMFDNLKIGTKLFLINVLSAVIPIAIVAVVVGIFISRSIDSVAASVKDTRDRTAGEIIGEQLKDEAVVTAQQIDAYLFERIHEVSGWAVSPVIRQAARDGSSTAFEKNLVYLDENEQENRMGTTRALSEDQQIYSYLKDLIKHSPAFSEVFFTDEHGFVVAHTNITSDFVQKGEDWWEQALASGSYVGQVGFDESSGVYSVEIDVRITDEVGNPLGVMKAILNVSAVQQLGAESAERVPQGIVRIFDQNGYLISDSSNNNDPGLIMQDSGNLLKRGWAAAQQIIDSNKASGYLLNQLDLDQTSIILGHAKMASGNYYNLTGFDGFGWIVSVEQPAQVALEPLNPLSEGVTDLERTRQTIIFLSIGVSILAAAIATLAAYMFPRGLVKSIDELAAAGQRFSSGDMDVSVEVRHKDEIGVLENTFQQMIVRLRAMVLKERNEREYMEQTVQRYLQFMHRVGSGNLRDRLELNGHQHPDQISPEQDPLMRLGMDLNQLTSSLHQMILQVQDAANQLASASSEILAATTQQASSASEQSAAIAQTTTTMGEVKTIADSSAMRAQEVADTAHQTVQISRAGQTTVEDTIGSMGQIKEQVERIAESILELSEQMQQIDEITSTVNDIASRSNMLALNASVEAARAGEHGRGFAVVAAEVRTLAEQSRQATAQIKSILQDIQRATNVTVMATEEGTKGVEKGVQLSQQTRVAIDQLSSAINLSAQNATQMVAAGQQQSAGVEQVAMAMQNINQATLQTLASTRQAEKAAQNLNELARHLTDTVSQYQV